MTIYAADGRPIRTLHEGARQPGDYSLSWNRRDAGGGRLARGVYFVHFEAGSTEMVRKLVLARD